RELLGNALRVGELTVSDVVMPRTRMIAASADSTVEELLRLAATSHYTRIPVYEGSIDHIVGIAHLKDLFRLYRLGKTSVKGSLRKVSFVPETMSINDVWQALNRERTYLAIVFDEYGGTVGMVTREDLLEVLFGEVQDEFDEDEEPPIKKVGEREYEVGGDLSIAYLNSQLDLDLSAEHAHTVSGLIVALLERIPEVGDEVTLDRVRFRVLSIKDRMADKVLVKLPGEEEA